MRLFSTPKTSPELVRHAIVDDNLTPTSNSESKAESMPPDINNACTTPPRTHSPSLVRGVSTLGRKFSRRFEKFGDSEAARKLRMASPSRNKYNFNGQNLPSSQPQMASNDPNKHQKVVSRVDSFRNFFLATASTTLKTPRAVKRRSRNAEKHRSSSQGKLVDAATSTEASLKNKKSFHRNHFGSELTLPDLGHNDALSECQSEADLRGYCTVTEDEDDRSVVSDFHQQIKNSAKLRCSSAGNLAARLGILPENRTILNFKEAGKVFSTTHGKL